MRGIWRHALADWRTWMIGALLWGLAAGPALAAPTRFTNGNLETGSTAGWSVYNPTGAPLTWGVTREAANVHGGVAAGQISVFGAGEAGLLLVHNSAPVGDLPAGALVRVRYYLKSTNLVLKKGGAGARAILVSLNGSGKVLTYAYETGVFAGDRPYSPVEFLLELPPGAASVQVQIALDAGIQSGSLCFDDLTFERLESLPPTSSTELPDCKVAPDGAGMPRLTINGVQTPPLFFFGNSGSAVIYEEIAKARPAGVRLIQVPITLPWVGASTSMIQQVLQANPDAWILPRIAMYAPDDWIASHDVSRILNENGQPVSTGPMTPSGILSPASAVLREAMKHQLELLIRYLQQSPYKDRIIGYHPTYLQTGEWFYPDTATHYQDFSEDNRKGFADWAAVRFANNLARLNTSWGTSYTSFSQITIPPAAEWEAGDDGVFRNPAARRRVTDFLEYQNWLITDLMLDMAGQIKTLTGRRGLVAYFYGYQNELISNSGRRGMGHTGHLGVRRVLASADIDFLCSPLSYYDRQVGGPCNLMSIVDSIALAGKLPLQEEDSNTYLIDPGSNPDPFNPWYSTQWDTLQCLRRNFGHVLGHGMATWWMDLWADGRYNGEDIWQNNGQLVTTYADSLDRGLAPRPQIALIYDEDTFLWMKADAWDLNNASGYAQRSVFQTCGAQVGYYHIDDLARIPASARLLVFVNTYRMTDSERALVRTAQTGGRTLLWLYAPGYVGEDAISAARMAELTSMTLYRNGASLRPKVTIGSASHPAIAGLEGQSFGLDTAIQPVFQGDGGGTPGWPTGNLLVNPSFENGAEGWGVWELAPQVTVTVEEDAAQAHQGARCVRMDFTPAASIVTFNQDLAGFGALGVPAGAQLRFSAWYRANLSQSAGRIRLAKVYGDTQHQLLPATWTDNGGLAGSRSAWTEQTLEFTHPGDPQRPHLRVLLNADSATPGTGSVWWDDTRLEVVAPANAASRPELLTAQTTDTAPVVTLGVYEQNGKPALLARDFGSWKSVFCGAPNLSTPVLRALARYAGVNLLVDGDDLGAQDAVESNGRYLYIYARGRAGRRCFQLPGEKVPNGGFEKFAGNLPTNGFGRWISPFYGTLATCTVARGAGLDGGNGLHTGAFSSGAGQYGEPAGIRLLAEDGKTYDVSCAVRVSGLNAAGAAAGDYLSVNCQPHAWTADSASFRIAEGSKVKLKDGVWSRFTARVTHHATSSEQPEMVVRVQVNGRYAATDIALDDVSVREADCVPVKVTEVLSGRVLGQSVTGWTDDLAQNEQKIYRLEGPGDSARAVAWSGYD